MSAGVAGSYAHTTATWGRENEGRRSTLVKDALWLHPGASITIHPGVRFGLDVPVVGYQFGDFAVALVAGVVEMVEGLDQRGAHGAAVVLAEGHGGDVKALAVMALEHFRRQGRRHVVMEVGGEIGDAYLVMVVSLAPPQGGQGTGSRALDIMLRRLELQQAAAMRGALPDLQRVCGLCRHRSDCRDWLSVPAEARDEAALPYFCPNREELEVLREMQGGGHRK